MKILRTPCIWGVYGAVVGNFLVIQFGNTFLPIYLNSVFGYSTLSAGLLGTFPMVLQVTSILGLAWALSVSVHLEVLHRLRHRPPTRRQRPCEGPLVQHDRLHRLCSLLHRCQRRANHVPAGCGSADRRRVRISRPQCWRLPEKRRSRVSPV